MKAALALITISTLNALMASPAPVDRPAKNAMAEGTNTRPVKLRTMGGFRSRSFVWPENFSEMPSSMLTHIGSKRRSVMTDVFRMLVRDDGKGIDPKILKDGGRPGHWGMAGVHERARGIGARLEFWSEAGAGTEVRLTIPAAIAYEKPRSGTGFKLFRKRRFHEYQS